MPLCALRARTRSVVCPFFFLDSAVRKKGNAVYGSATDLPAYLAHHSISTRFFTYCLERKRARAPRAPDPRVPSESVARPPRGSALSRRTRAPHRHSHDHMNDSSLWRDGSTRQLPRRSLARGSGRHKHCTCRRGAVWLSAEGAGRRSAKAHRACHQALRSRLPQPPQKKGSSRSA